MNTSINGYWDDTKNKLRQRFANLTEDDLFFIEGKESIMLERIQFKLGKTKEELREILIKL